RGRVDRRGPFRLGPTTGMLPESVGPACQMTYSIGQLLSREVTTMTRMTRRDFNKTATAIGAVAATRTLVTARAKGADEAAKDKPKRIKVGVIGCGSVSGVYLPHLSKCLYVELVSACDIIPERAAQRAKKFNIPHHYPHIDKMLSGAAFDLLVDLTDMQEHEHLNREALESGKHVWSEKPIPNSLDAGRELLALSKKKGVRLWGAPTVVNSPQFAFMARTLAAGKLGCVAAAHADYGHTGPGWSSFFYEKGGGSMPDLMVSNRTTLTVPPP